jgi:hypothetical protein
LDKHQTVCNTYGRNKLICEQICLQIYIYLYLWLSLNLGVYCSLKKSDVLRGLLLIQWQRLCFTAKIRLASWIVNFTMYTPLQN